MTKEEKMRQVVENKGDCSLGGLGAKTYVSCCDCPLGCEFLESSVKDRLKKAKNWLEKYTKQPTKKKRGPKPNKREKLEARLSQVEETTKEAFTCICDKEGYELGEFRSGKYTSTFDMNPEQAVQFAKWVLDLEGGK